jgi:hypothetical protein
MLGEEIMGYRSWVIGNSKKSPNSELMTPNLSEG